MKLLLDHCIPRRLRASLTGHEVTTASELGWDGLRNGALLRAASEAGFDAMITVDQNLKHQQNLAKPVAVAVLCSASNDLDTLLELVPDLLEALRTLAPRTIVEVVGRG